MKVLDFEWTFPCYVLAVGATLHDDGIGCSVNKDTKFIAPTIDGSTLQGVAFFTDSALAEEYRERHAGDRGIHAIQLSTVLDLEDFLCVIRPYYPCIVIDPHPISGFLRVASTDVVIQACREEMER